MSCRLIHSRVSQTHLEKISTTNNHFSSQLIHLIPLDCVVNFFLHKIVIFAWNFINDFQVCVSQQIQYLSTLFTRRSAPLSRLSFNISSLSQRYIVCTIWRIPMFAYVGDTSIYDLKTSSLLVDFISLWCSLWDVQDLRSRDRCIAPMLTSQRLVIKYWKFSFFSSRNLLGSFIYFSPSWKEIFY